MRIAKYGSASVFMLIALVAVTWFFSAPQNSLYLTHSDIVSDDDTLTKAANEIFFLSDTYLTNAFNRHKELSTAIRKNTNFDYNKPTYTLNKPTLRDFVENMGYKYGNESGFYFHFDLVEWLERLYVKLGWEGRGIQIAGLRKDNSELCNTEQSNGERSEDSQCWRLTVRFLPATIYSETIPARIYYGTDEELAKDMAVFVMKGIIRDEETKWNDSIATETDARPPFLLADSTPSSMVTLENITQGFMALHNCTDHACLRKVAALLSAQIAIERKRHGGASASPNPVASLGLALASLQEATIDVDSGFPTYPNRIEARLWEMETHLKNARKSSFIRWAMRDESLPEFQFVYRSVPISPQLFLSGLGYKLACALRDYRRARWSECLENLVEIELLPRSLQPYFLAAKYDAQLLREVQNGKVSADFSKKMSNIQTDLERLSGSHNMQNPESLYIWPLKLVAARHSCKSQASDSTFYAKQLELRRMSDVREIVLAVVMAYCTDSEMEQSDVVAWEAKFVEGTFGRMVLDFELARHFVRRGNLDRGRVHATKALHLDWAHLAYSWHPDFLNMENVDELLEGFQPMEDEQYTDVPKEACPEKRDIWGS